MKFIIIDVIWDKILFWLSLAHSSLNINTKMVLINQATLIAINTNFVFKINKAIV